MSDRLTVLHSSVSHLGEVAATLSPDDYVASAYPESWTVADTFSHVGSGAVIGQRRVEDFLNERENDPNFNPTVWDAWNAKEPSAQVADALASDREFMAVLDAVPVEQRQAFRFSMGPFDFDFEGLVGLRLSEHALHTWDIEVTTNLTATLSPDAANAILDSIQFIVARSAKPTGEAKDVYLRTTDSSREFTLALQPDTVELREEPHAGATDLEIPSESLVRLIYGRLDGDHTPPTVTGDVLDEVRGVFPGF